MLKRRSFLIGLIAFVACPSERGREEEIGGALTYTPLQHGCHISRSWEIGERWGDGNVQLVDRTRVISTSGYDAGAWIAAAHQVNATAGHPWEIGPAFGGTQ